MGNELLNMGEEQLMLYHEHSKAIFQFTLLEGLLASLVTNWAEDEQGKILFNSFYGIENFRSKLEFLDRFMLNHIGDNAEHKKAWKFALDKCKAVAQERNKLAHWYMAFYSDERPGRRIVMIPPAFNPGDSFSLDNTKAEEGKLPGYALTIHGIAGITNKITDAWMYVFRAKNLVLGVEDTTDGMVLPNVTHKFEVLLKSFRYLHEALLPRRPPRAAKAKVESAAAPDAEAPKLPEGQ